MSSTAALWVAIAGFCLLRSFRRPAFAVALYLLIFFAAPHLWWWGRDLPEMRYSYISGYVLLVSALIHRNRNPTAEQPGSIVYLAALGMVVNSVLVHFAFATSPGISLENLIEAIKFALLFYLMAVSIKDKGDLRIVLMAIALGAGYIGYEVTINDRGDFSGARLEGVGAPGADTSNDLACLMLVALPLVGSLFVGGSKLTMATVLVCAPLVLNVVLLCNSRGAFLGLVGGGVVLLFLARGPTRKKAIRSLALGAIALYMLLGDPDILERFTTTFVGAEERDRSAASRIEMWQAGLKMLADYPLGAGGGAFKYVHGSKYVAAIGSQEGSRSLHNGYLTEATDWGVQGLALKLTFLGAALLAAWRTSARCRIAGRADDALIGLCFIASAASFLIAAMFGSFLSDEWGYWLVALLVGYARLYDVSEQPAAVMSHASQVTSQADASAGFHPHRPERTMV